MGLVDRGQTDVVARELPALGTKELGRRGHRGRGHTGLTEVGQVGAPRQAEVRRAGELILPILPVVEVDHQPPGASERRPLPELVGSRLLGRLGNHDRRRGSALAPNVLPPSSDTFNRILLLQAPSVLTPVYSGSPSAAKPSGLHPFSALESRLMYEASDTITRLGLSGSTWPEA